MLLLALLASGAAAVLPEGVRCIAALAALAWLPGWRVTERFFSSVFSPSVIPVAALLIGLSIVALISAVFTVLRAPFLIYAGALQVIVAAFYFTDWIVGVRAARREAARPPSRRAAWWVYAGLLVIGGVAAGQSPNLNPAQDSFDHIGYMRQISVTNEMRPAGVLVEPTDTDALVPQDPRKGAFHPAAAAMSRLAGVTPFVFWTWIPVVIFPLAVLAFSAFCAPFVAGGLTMALCLAMFLLSYGGVGLHFAHEVINGQNLAVMWYWLLVPTVLALDSGVTRQRRFVIAILACGGTLVHLGVAVHVAILGLTVVVFASVLGLERRAALRGTVALALGVGAGVIMRWGGGETFGVQPNFLHAHPQGLLYTGGDGFVMSPMEILRQHGLLFLGGLASLPVVAFLARRRVDARRQLMFAAFPAAAAFVPLWTPALFSVGSYMVFRTLLNVPVFPVALTAAAGLLAWSYRGGWSRRAVTATILIAWSLLFLTPSVRAFVRSITVDTTDFLVSQKPLLRALASLPGEGVLLSDTRSSYVASATTDHRVVAVAQQHGNPFDSHARDRLIATRDVLSPFVPASLVVDACERYGVDFVICNGRLPVAGSDPMAPWDWRFYDAAVARLQSIAGRFRKVYEQDRVTVFIYDPAGTGESQWPGIPMPLSFEGPAVTSCQLFAPDSTFAISGVRVHPLRAIPGDTLTVTVAYYKWDQPLVDFPLELHVRVDHESVFSQVPYPGEKYVRRAVERWDGRLRRFRADHVPFEGFLGPELWPIGKEFYETFSMAVPRRAKLGTYRFELSFERAAFLPNFSLRDFVYNRDHYSGIACVELEITDQVVR